MSGTNRRRRDDGQDHAYSSSVSQRTRSQPVVNWNELAPEVRAVLDAGINEAERGEFVDLTPDETEHYLRTGELPERLEQWLDSYDSRTGT
jgi:hypothetical protein